MGTNPVQASGHEGTTGPSRTTLAAGSSADVIVVGAGLAGLAAARAIQDKLGAGSVIVLEARNRIGGRCWTAELPAKNGGKVRADLGAGWVHGLTGNPVAQLASSLGVALASKKTNYDNSWTFLPSGAEASAAQESRWESLFEDFEDSVADRQDDLEDTSQDPGLGAQATQFMQRRGLTGLDKMAFLHYLNINIEHEYAGSMAQLSLWFDWGAEEYGGDKFVTGGYQRLAEQMAKGLDVRLGHVVTKIDSSSANSIKLSTAGMGIFTARRIVVAVPAGVLQANAIQFLPSGLAAANQKALGQLGMGLLNKLVMVFDKPFWEDPSIEILNRIPPNGDGAWAETYSLLPITGEPVLVAFNAASYASQLESKAAAAVKDEYMAVLRTMFDDVPEPRSYAVTAWGADPYAQGSYSYTKKGVAGNAGYATAHKDCAKPMASSRIFFAGEHTRADHPATTHGAVLSGRKAAADLLAVTKKA